MATYECPNRDCGTVWTPTTGRPTLRPIKRECPDCVRVRAAKAGA